MLSLVTKYRVFFVSVFLCLISLHMATTEKRGTGGEKIVSSVILTVSRPLTQAMLWTKNTIVGTWTGYFYLIGLKVENDELRDSMDRLTSENTRLKEELARVERNLELDTLFRGLPKEYSAVRASAVSFSGFDLSGAWARTVMINKGSMDGIERDMPVITTRGVVGRTIEVYPYSSRVLLVTDPRSNIDVQDQRTRTRGLATGSGHGTLIIKYVRTLEDVMPGDTIISGGLSEIFPQGLVVGTVLKVKEADDKFFKDIELVPAADIKRLEDMLVLTSILRPTEDKKPASAADETKIKKTGAPK